MIARVILFGWRLIDSKLFRTLLLLDGLTALASRCVVDDKWTMP